MKYIYLHGFASGPSSGKAQWFRRRFADCGVDLRIPDLAEGDFERLTLTGQLRVVNTIAAGEPCVLVGSSMGGYLAALYASAHPEVSRLVLLAPAFDFPRRWLARLGPEAATQWRTTGRMDVFHYEENRSRELRYELIEDAENYPPAPACSQPALIFHGTNDDVVPVSSSEEYAAGKANVRLRVLPSDHQLTDSVETIWEDVRPFLGL